MDFKFKEGVENMLVSSPQRNIRHVLRSTKEEDDFLKEEITKHGFGQWSAISRDDDFQLQDGRRADSLKERAGIMRTYIDHSSNSGYACKVWVEF